MTVRYVDPAGSNTSPYDTWAKAATNIQTVLDLAVAGDIIYCRGTQTTTATIDVDTQTGTNDAGYIRVIGCNASGNVDGTRFVLNANGGSYSVVTAAATSDMYWWENIEVKNTAVGTYYGFTGPTGTAGWIFINCCANTVGAGGFYLANFTHPFLWRCVAYSNGGNGFVGGPMRAHFCVSRDNSTDGFTGVGLAFGCIAHGNTDDGFGGINYGNNFLYNCVSDGNGDDGIELAAHTELTPIILIGCRVTNHSGAGDIGLNCAGEPIIVGYCYFENNGGAGEENIQNDNLYYFIPLENSSTTSNVNEGEDEDDTDTNQGYVDPTNHDFSTNYVSASDPNIRRTAITLPWS